LGCNLSFRRGRKDRRDQGPALQWSRKSAQHPQTCVIPTGAKRSGGIFAPKPAHSRIGVRGPRPALRLVEATQRGNCPLPIVRCQGRPFLLYCRCCGVGQGLGRALRITGAIRRAAAPPRSAVISWGQEKAAGRACSIGAFSTPVSRSLRENTPQMSQTTAP